MESCKFCGSKDMEHEKCQFMGFGNDESKDLTIDTCRDCGASWLNTAGQFIIPNDGKQIMGERCFIGYCSRYFKPEV